MELSDKFAIVTGSTRGTGFAIAQGPGPVGAALRVDGGVVHGI